MEKQIKSFNPAKYQAEINMLLKAGLKPVAVSYMYFEPVFVFETFEEVEQAIFLFNNPVRDHIISAWWYTIQSFNDARRGYETFYNPNAQLCVYSIMSDNK